MNMRPPTAKQIREWRNGGEGFAKFINDNVWLPIYKEGSDIATWYPMGDLPNTPNPETGRSYKSMWLRQLEHLTKALEMTNGRFNHRLIILCWMRGEGKSANACLIQTWKFFCWPRQQIVLGANSKEQTKFVHYDIIRDTIRNSPQLLAMVGGQSNIKEKEICMTDQDGNSVSSIRAISSFSGIVSNITGYTFSEIFDMKNPKFFNQLDGSIRNVPNALGVIDSTVSDKGHVLYKMYEKQANIKDLFFSHRESPAADMDDYYHPYMSQKQLDSYREKMDAASFSQYFRNTWDAGSLRFFPDEQVEAINYWGMGNKHSEHADLVDTLKNVIEARKVLLGFTATSSVKAEIHESKVAQLKSLTATLTPVDTTIQLVDALGLPKKLDLFDLEALSDIYDTDWSLHAGFDRADPMAATPSAHTVLTVVAKGLPGSRTGFSYYAQAQEVPYIYVLVHISVYHKHDLEDIKNELVEVSLNLDGIDTFCGERWGAWDMLTWGEKEAITVELISPTYEKQKACFGELHTIVTNGRFKSAPTHIPGVKGNDILKEEMGIFTHDAQRKWFGSPEKGANGGIQDDVMYSLGWGIYGGRGYAAHLFRRRGRNMSSSGYVPPVDLYALY